MAPPSSIFVYVYYNGQILRNDHVGTYFQSDETRQFKVNRRSNFVHLKDRIEKKHGLGKVVSDIIYRNPVFFVNGTIQFEPLKILDDDDVEVMFDIHNKFTSVIASIELCVNLEECQPSSNNFYPSTTSQPFPTQETQTFHDHFEPSSSQLNTYQPSSSQYDIYQPSSSQYDIYQPSSSQFDIYQPSYSQFDVNLDPPEEPYTHQDEVGDESEDESYQLEQSFDDSEEEEDEDEDEDEYDVTPIREAYVPPSHMASVDLAYDDQYAEIGHTPTLPVDGDLEKGRLFHNKKDCIIAIRQHHIKNSVDYTVVKYDPKRYIIKCVIPQCSFKCRASQRKRRSDMWEIGRLNSHTCTSSALSQDHRKLDSSVICQSVKSLVEKDPSVKVKVIIAHIREKYNYTTTYRKAWIAKNKAIEEIYGNWEESYKELPQWLIVMQTFLPETVIQMETLQAADSNGNILQDRVIFHRLFWAFHPCIKGFAYCKPIVQVDGTWLYGKYKGTLLMVVAQDGNSNIFPIAFTLVEGETKDGWSFFLKNLRRHVTPQSGICLISDRHESIKSAYNNPENGWQDLPSRHVYCVRHIAQNFMREFKVKDLRKKVINMGYAMNKPLLQYYRREIGRENLDAGRWVDNIPREQWTQAYDDGLRWGHMTTNLAESINSVLKGTRNLPITALVKSTYFKLVDLFVQRGKQWNAVLNSGQAYTEKCMKMINEAVHKSNSHRVTHFDRQNHTFSVQETVNQNEGRPMGHFKVDLLNKSCDCGRFQALHLPCSHVIAACSSVRHEYHVHISDVYKVSTVYNVYNEPFQVIQNEAFWPPYQGINLHANSEMRRTKKGRPSSTRIRSEMDDFAKQPRNCGLCKQPGHNRSRCPNVEGPSN